MHLSHCKCTSSTGRQEWVKSSTPYPISMSVEKLKKILDVSEPMDPDVFNLGVRILAPNALESVKRLRKPIVKHYMDLEFSVCFWT